MNGRLRFSSVDTMPGRLRDMVLAQGKGAPREPATPTARAGKYNNHPTTVDGIRFDSKREARYYEQLKIHKQLGEVAYFLLQVPIRLPGGTRYIVDFQVFWADGRVEYVDAKGKETQVFRLKKREVEHHYPITIRVV